MRDFTDGVSATSTSWVSSSAAFTAADEGVSISGSNIPNGTTIVTVTNATTVVLSHATTATGTGLSFHIARAATLIATVDDLQGRIARTLSDAERSTAATLLLDASGRVRRRCRQTITAVAGDTVRLRTTAGKVRLPQRPVTDVASVHSTDGNDLEFQWNGGDTVDLVPPGSTFSTWWNCWDGQWWLHPAVRAVDVVYDHGYTEVPDELVAVVCQMAARALGLPADRSGESSRTVDGYVVTIGSAAAAGALGMLADERDTVDRYRRSANTVRLG